MKNETNHQIIQSDTHIRKYPGYLKRANILRLQKGGNWYDNLQGFERIASHEGMMLTWLAGEEAEIMEQLPEKEIQDVLHELLVIFTNNTAIPPPKKILR